MNRKQRKLLSELKKRSERKESLDTSCLFPQQRAFVEDTRRLVIACCSRRAGKSFGLAFKYARVAEQYPGCIMPYLTQTREAAKDIMHPAFRELDEKHNIGIRFRENNGDVIFPNGSKVILRGISTEREVQKLRGPKYPLVGIDEAQGMGSLMERAILEVIMPATMDYNGQTLVTGTPGAACAGPFYKYFTDKGLGWSRHHWTVRDNVFHTAVKDGFLEKWLAELRTLHGWEMDTPAYLREYLGIWIKDTDSLVFKLNPKVNIVPDVPWSLVDDWEHVLGVDFGFNDPTAFVVLSFSPTVGQAYIVESYKEAGLIPSTAAAHIARLMERYDFNYIVGDTGGLGKGYTEEMKRSFQIPITPADKAKKTAYISFFNGDLQSGSLKIVESGNLELLEEMSMLQWDANSLTRNSFAFDRKFQDHLCDAALYGWRETMHHTGRWEKDAPKPGEKEFSALEEAKIWERRAQALQQGPALFRGLPKKLPPWLN